MYVLKTNPCCAGNRILAKSFNPCNNTLESSTDMHTLSFHLVLFESSYWCICKNSLDFAEVISQLVEYAFDKAKYSVWYLEKRLYAGRLQGLFHKLFFYHHPVQKWSNPPSQYQRGDPRSKMSEPVKWQGCNNKENVEGAGQIGVLLRAKRP